MTLIELLMVMVIMVIIMSVSLPAFNSMGRGSDLRGAVSSVRSALVQSRQWAITHRERVTFQWETNCYYVTNDAGLYLQATNMLPLSVRFQNSDQVTFKSDGSLASGTTPVDIVLVRSNASPMTIQIMGLTGGVQVK